MNTTLSFAPVTPAPQFDRITKPNECGVWVMNFERDGVRHGHMNSTRHRELPYEVVSETLLTSARIRSPEEAESWLIQNGVTPRG